MLANLLEGGKSKEIVRKNEEKKVCKEDLQSEKNKSGNDRNPRHPDLS